MSAAPRGPLTRAFYALHHRAIERPRDARVVDGLARQVGQAGSLLDVGVSHGRIARDVGARVGASRVEGVDVKLPERCAVPARLYDGERLPFEADAFDAALLSDMLHHAARPAALLREALRVARVLAIKDHVRFGPVSGAVLWGMDVVGNGGNGIAVRGTYFTLPEWIALVEGAGGKVTRLEWPLRIHDAPFRWLTPDALQLVMRVERA